MPKEIGNLKLYTLKEVSEKLNVSTASLRIYLRNGRLRGRKFGKSWYVSETALEDYFSSEPKEELQ